MVRALLRRCDECERCTVHMSEFQQPSKIHRLPPNHCVAMLVESNPRRGSPEERAPATGATALKIIPMYIIAVATMSASAAAPADGLVSLAQPPLVMRLNKD